jgi:hypothetical protein
VIALCPVISKFLPERRCLSFNTLTTYLIRKRFDLLKIAPDIAIFMHITVDGSKRQPVQFTCKIPKVFIVAMSPLQLLEYNMAFWVIMSRVLSTITLFYELTYQFRHIK